MGTLGYLAKTTHRNVKYDFDIFKLNVKYLNL